ncbi:hypothetical protein ACKLNO_02770 [Neisseriaceae bacterium B1]
MDAPIFLNPPAYESLTTISGKIEKPPIEFGKWQGIYVQKDAQSGVTIYCDIQQSPLRKGSPKSQNDVLGRCDWLSVPQSQQLYGKEITAKVHDFTIYELEIEGYSPLPYLYFTSQYRAQFLANARSAWMIWGLLTEVW